MGPNHVKSGIFLRLQRVRKRYSWINEDSLVVGIPLSILCNSTLLLLGLLSAEYEWWCHWLKECQIQPFWHGLALFASMLCAGRCCLCPSLTPHTYQSYQSWQLSTVETNPPRSTETLLKNGLYDDNFSRLKTSFQEYSFNKRERWESWREYNQISKRFTDLHNDQAEHLLGWWGFQKLPFLWSMKTKFLL